MLILYSSIWSQGWRGTGYDLNITVPENNGKIDMIATANGIHVLRGLSNTLNYRRYDVQGNYISGSDKTIAIYSEMPKIFTIVEQNGDLYVFYMNNSQLLVKRSTDGGNNFSTVASPVTVQSQSNGIDAVVMGNDIHVVWSELPSNETYYQVFDTQNEIWNSTTFKNITDHPSGQNGSFPDIALSSNRVHVGFSASLDPFSNPSYVYSRDKGTDWLAPEQQSGVRNMIATTSNKLHMIIYNGSDTF